MKLHNLILAAAPILLLDIHQAQPQPVPYVTLGEPTISGGGTSVQPGDVYGVAEFRLVAPAGAPVEAQVQGLVQALVASQFGNNQGSYLLTVELSRGNEVLAIKPIITVSYQNDRFLFWNVSRSVSRDVFFAGTIAETGPVTAANNRVTVSIKSYYKSEGAFDMTLFDLIGRYDQQFNLLSQLPGDGLASTVIKTLRQTLAEALSESTKVEDVFRYDMAFARIGGANATRVLAVPIRFGYRSGSTYRGELQINLRTWSISSKFMFDVDEGEFVDPSSFTYLNNVLVPSSGQPLTILEYFSRSGSDPVRTFLDDLFSADGYQGDAIFAECTRLLSSYASFLTNRDALALLWATISEYRTDFRRAGASECISGRSEDMERLGLPTSTLIQYLEAR